MVIALLPSRRHVVRPGRRARARPALRAYSMNGASCLRNAAAFLALRSISCSVPPTANRTVSTAGPPVRSSSSTAAPNQISGGSGVHLSILPWPSVPWGLRSAGAAGVLLGLVAWFGVELITGGGLAGLAERLFGAAQALWPLAVVASCRHAARTATRPSLNQPGPHPAGGARRPARGARNSRFALSRQGSPSPVQPNRIA